MRFFTNVALEGSTVLIREVNNGKRIKKKVRGWEPVIYKNSQDPNASWKTIYGDPVEEIQPGSIVDCKKYERKYEEVIGVDIFTAPNYITQYINDTYSNDFDINQINIFHIDIETETEHGFPNIEEANEKIQLITLKKRDAATITFGTKPYSGKKGAYKYYETEEDMLQSFIKFWKACNIDVISGWNIDGFDIPYMINRIKRLFGNKEANKLSPFGKIIDKNFISKYGDIETYSISGIAILDYIHLLKKYEKSERGSYKLDDVAEDVLKRKKLENPHVSWKDFYTKDWDRFVDYNIVDTELVDEIDKKLKMISIQISMAYKAGINYEEVFAQGRVWDSLIYKYLKDKNTIIPPKKITTKKGKFKGAYVKPTITGMHKWVAAFDLNSLYPHSIMQYNISPETITDTCLKYKYDEYQKELSKLSDIPLDLREKKESALRKEYLTRQVIEMNLEKFNTSPAHDNNLALSGNGWCYRKDIRGFLPDIIENFYAERVEYKKRMKEARQEYEKDKSRTDLLEESERLHIHEYMIKIALNSAYGTLGSPHFRYYDIRLAESITMSSQLSIRWIQKRVNEFLNKSLKTKDEDYIIAMDTDSLYLNLEKFIEKYVSDKTTSEKIDYMDKITEQVIQPFIDKQYKALAKYMNAYEHKMSMKREYLCDKGIWRAKKQYVLRIHDNEGVRYDEPEIKNTGLEIIKQRTPMPVKKKMEQLMHIIFEEDNRRFLDFINEFREEFNKLDAEDVSFTVGVTELDKWKDKDKIYSKGTPIHVRGALLYNSFIKKNNLLNKYELIKEHDKIKYTYLRLPNSIRENVISYVGRIPEEMDIRNYVDYETQFKKTFTHPIDTLVGLIGWQTKEVKSLSNFID